ncbi:MAG: hypothetical protein ACRDQY_05300 [Pseudonocardiaceae bacterium]
MTKAESAKDTPASPTPAANPRPLAAWRSHHINNPAANASTTHAADGHITGHNEALRAFPRIDFRKSRIKNSPLFSLDRLDWPP